MDFNEEISSKSPFFCLGFGIVRGIDKVTDKLYILTPVPEETLQNVNLLVKGNITLPPSICMTSCHQGLVPYIMLGIPQGTSSLPKRSFRNWGAILRKHE